MSSARAVQYPARLLEAVDQVNTAQKGFIAGRMRRHFGATGLGWAHLRHLGSGIKPNTDDMREAPALALIEDLPVAGAAVQAYDPVSDARAALQGADARAIITEWQEFRSPEFDYIKATLREPMVFDGRNLYNPDLMRRQGFSFYAVERGLA